MASVNIVCMDHYMRSPIKDLDHLVSEFRAATIDKVPIIRIFGSTYEGVKACVHIHGVFPYFYVPCDKDSDNPIAIAYQLAASLDKAINITLNQATSSQQHVYCITLEHGIPFYGYHLDEHKFFKMSFYNPLMVKKASTLLQSGNILGTVFQPFECHIPYKQQFMIDFNLFGMNFVRFANIKHRDEKNQSRKKQSVCPMEFDVLAKDVLNQYEIIPGNVACNPGIQYIRDEEMKRCGANVDDMAESNLTQNRVDVSPTATDVAFCEKLRALLMKKGTTTTARQSQNDLSFSNMSDITILDGTQLEEDAQLLMNLFNANRECGNDEETEEIDENCILSQKPTKNGDDNNDDEFELNMSLIDCVSGTSINLIDVHKTD